MTQLLDDTISIFDPNLKQLYFDQLGSQQNINIFVWRNLISLRDKYVDFTKQQNVNNTQFANSTKDHSTRLATAESNIKTINDLIDQLDQFSRTLNGDILQHKMNVDKQFNLYTNSINSISKQGDDLTVKVTTLESALSTLKSNINADKLQAFIDSHQNLLKEIDDKIANYVEPINDELATFEAEVKSAISGIKATAESNRKSLFETLDQYNSSQVERINTFIKQANDSINFNKTQASNDNVALQNELQAQINAEKGDRVSSINELQGRFNVFSTTTNEMFSGLQLQWETYQKTVTARLDNFHSYIVNNIDRVDRSIADAVSTINKRVDSEVATLNTRTDTEVKSLNDRTDTEVKSLNDRIDSEVKTINENTDNLVQTIESRIDQVESNSVNEDTDIRADIEKVTNFLNESDNTLQSNIDKVEATVKESDKRLSALEFSDTKTGEQIVKFLEQLTTLQQGNNNLITYYKQLSGDIKDETANRISEDNQLSETVGNFGVRVTTAEEKIVDLLELIKFGNVVKITLPSDKNVEPKTIDFPYGSITYSTDGSPNVNLVLSIDNVYRVLISENGNPYQSPSVNSGVVNNSFTSRLSTSDQLKPMVKHLYIFDTTSNVVKPYELNVFYNPLDRVLTLYSNKEYVL